MVAVPTQVTRHGLLVVKILHLSDTTLSGSPYRTSKLYNKYTDNEARHMVWQRNIFNRVFTCDLVGEELSQDERQEWLDWADIIHYHNRWKRQNIFKFHKAPNKPSVIQMHSPREEEKHLEELDSGIPIAVIAQYHVRQWPELKFIVPNVVDIYDPSHMPKAVRPARRAPVISYAPSSPNGRGWNNKSYNTVHAILKKMWYDRWIDYQRIIGKPHEVCLKMKQQADIGIDEVSTGSYHLSSLEYLSMGVACIGRLDEQTEKVIKDITGADWLPWAQCTEAQFNGKMISLVQGTPFIEIGKRSREWMETYWAPEKLCKIYTDMYSSL